MFNFKKNNTTGRILALLMMLSVLVSMVCVSAVGVNAEETESGTLGYFEYTVDSDGVCITKYTGDGGDVSIPNIIDDKSVVAIGDEAFWYCDKLTAIDLPDYLEYIGARAFQGCKSLRVVSLPDCVLEISDAAFEGCSSLMSVNIPSELIYVGSFAFDSTPWITKFEDNDSIILGGRIFYKYKGDADMVTIPKGVTGISSNAFSGNKKLTYVTIPDTVMFIGDFAFFECPALKSASIPDGVYYLGKYSFGYNSVNSDGSGDVVEDFVLYANDSTLGADYAKTYELSREVRAKNPTPDELPEEEKCIAKSLAATMDEAAKNQWFSNENSVAALIIIVVSCVVIIGGLYLYFAISEKKMKVAKKAANTNKASKKKKKK